MTVKCLVEIEFTGPNAADGPQILVDKSNEMSKQHGGIPITTGCLGTTYRLVSEKPQKEMEERFSLFVNVSSLLVFLFIVGLVLCGLYLAYKG